MQGPLETAGGKSTGPGERKCGRSPKAAKRAGRQRRPVSAKPAHAPDFTDRRQWPGVPSAAEYRPPKRRRGRPRGAIAAPSRVALLIWWARYFPIRPSKIIAALSFDTGQSQGEKYVKRAVARVEADLKADKPQFFHYPGHSWDQASAPRPWSRANPPVRQSASPSSLSPVLE